MTKCQMRCPLMFAVLALWLAGCAPPNLTSHGITGANIFRPNPAALVYGGNTGSRNIGTAVVGNPFSFDQVSFAKTVASAMDSAVEGRDARFVVTANESVRPGVFATVAFDPAINATAADLCRERLALSTYPSIETVRVMMALCVASEPVSVVRARLTRGDGPGDLSFVRLIRKMTRAMLGQGGGPQNPVLR